MLDPSHLETALRRLLPDDKARRLARLLNAVILGEISGDQASQEVLRAGMADSLRALAGERLDVGTHTIDFGVGGQFGDVAIGDVAGQNLHRLDLFVSGGSVGQVVNHQIIFHIYPNQAGTPLPQPDAGEAEARLQGETITLNRPHNKEDLARQAQSREHIRDERRYLDERLRGFVGRTIELGELRAAIEARKSDGGYLVLTGPAGQGKSTLIAHLIVDRYRAYIGTDTSAQPVLENLITAVGVEQAIYHIVSSISEPNYQVAMLRDLLARLCLKHHLPLDYLGRDTRASLSDAFLRALKCLEEKGLGEVIFIDGLDQIARDDDRYDFSFLPPRPPRGIVIVLAVQSGVASENLRERTREEPYDLPSLSDADAKLLFSHCGIKLNDYQFGRLCDNLGNNALSLTLAARTLARQVGHFSLNEIYTQIYGKPEQDAFFVTAQQLRKEKGWVSSLKPLLAVLVTAREGLSARALGEIVGMDHTQVSESLPMLGALVVPNSLQRYALAVPQLREYFREQPGLSQQRYLFNSQECKDWDARLATWCLRGKSVSHFVRQDVDPLGDPERYEYAWRHLAAHLAGAQNLELLCELLDEPGYRQRRIRADQSMGALVTDLDSARQVLAAAQAEAGLLSEDRLAILWRYSLLRCSLISRGDVYPPSLFWALALVGREAEAVGRAELLQDRGQRVAALVAIGGALGVRPEAHALRAELLARAEDAAHAISDDAVRDEALIVLAGGLTQAGDIDGARRVAEKLSLLQDRDRVLHEVAVALAGASRPAEAKEELQKIDGQLARDQAAAAVVEALVSAGQPGAAGEIAREAATPHGCVAALCAAVRGLANSGAGPNEADTLLGEASAAARDILAPPLQVAAQAHIVGALVALRQPAEALDLLDQISAPAIAAWSDNDQAYALRPHIVVRAQLGQHDVARELVGLCADPARRVDLLALLGAEQYRLGQVGEVRRSLDAAQTTVTTIKERATLDRTRHLYALNTLAMVLTQVGQGVEACAVAQKIPAGRARIDTLAGIAAALATQGGEMRANRVCQTALDTIHEATDIFQRTLAHCAIARSLHALRRTREAQEVLDATELPGPVASVHDQALARITYAVTIGEVRQAPTHTVEAVLQIRDLLRLIDDSNTQGAILRAAVRALAQQRCWGEAEALAAEAPEEWQVTCLCELASALIQAGEIARAQKLLGADPIAAFQGDEKKSPNPMEKNIAAKNSARFALIAALTWTDQLDGADDLVDQADTPHMKAALLGAQLEVLGRKQQQADYLSKRAQDFADKVAPPPEQLVIAYARLDWDLTEPMAERAIKHFDGGAFQAFVGALVERGRVEQAAQYVCRAWAAAGNRSRLLDLLQAIVPLAGYAPELAARCWSDLQWVEQAVSQRYAGRVDGNIKRV